MYIFWFSKQVWQSFASQQRKLDSDFTHTVFCHTDFRCASELWETKSFPLHWSNFDSCFQPQLLLLTPLSLPHLPTLFCPIFASRIFTVVTQSSTIGFPKKHFIVQSRGYLTLINELNTITKIELFCLKFSFWFDWITVSDQSWQATVLSLFIRGPDLHTLVSAQVGVRALRRGKPQINQALDHDGHQSEHEQAQAKQNVKPDF